MALASGAKIGPYEIIAPIGSGGMGDVYRARDSRLGREVALKIIPESFARDSDRLRRFEQESRAVAALNHPNILAIHDVGEINGTPFLVSELLEGESLRATLGEGALSQRKTIEYGVQIAHGLAAAHEKNIVHRDLKPENLFLTRDGRIKILDFGLAKLTQKSGSSSDLNGITLTGSPTAAGMVMGTAGYMAPEQVRGQSVDARTDIFAFGAVLFEMASGMRAFQRETPAETMTAVLKEDPPETSNLARPIAPALDRIVRRCLEKNPEQRFQSAKDLSFALGSLTDTHSSPAISALPTGRKIPWLVWAAVAAAMVIAIAATWFFSRRPQPSPRMQFAIFVPGEVSHVALSRDGSMLAFVCPEDTSGVPMLFVEHVGSSTATPLPSTEGASFPFWSPDNAYLAFFANGKLEKISVSGGPPQVLTNVLAARGGSWGSRNVIIYAPDSGGFLWRINADGSGGAPVTDKIFTQKDQSHRWPVFLPDGNHFLFWAGNFQNLKDDRLSAIYTSSLDSHDRKLVTLCHSSFDVSSNHLFYADDDRHLITVPFDPSSATISGSPLVIADKVGFQPSTFWVALTASENGTLIYNTNTGAARSQLTWTDRSGKELGHIGEPGVMANPMISPDGNRVVVDISDQAANNVDIWIENANGSGNSRFTFDPAEEVAGIWSRDGSTLVFRTAGGGTGTLGLVTKRATGLEPEKEIFALTGADDIVPNAWSRGDQQILCTYESTPGFRLVLIPANGGNPTPFQQGRGNQADGQISPDGKWAAYASDESGNWEIYVTTFPGAAGKWQVSRGGGTEPRWRGDGKEIFYIGATGTLTAVPINSETSFSSGMPTPLFQIHGRAPISSTDTFTYDVTEDGARFLVNRYVKPADISPLNIVLNAAHQ